MNNSKLILGTVQFGLNYGINNKSGKPSFEEVSRILDYGYQRGINILDSAEAYGDAIDVIRKYLSNSSNQFQVISKFIATPDNNIKKNVEATLQKLKIENLYAYMYHKYSDYENNPALADSLNEIKTSEKIKFTGISIYSNEQFEKVVNDDNIDLIQFPYNLFDNDNQRGKLIEFAKSKNKILHCRSVLLQGLFYREPEDIPQKLLPFKKHIIRLNDICRKFNIDCGMLAYKYVLGNDKIDGLVMGVDNLHQLKENLKHVEGQPLDSALRDIINSINIEEKYLLNPSNW